MRHILIAMLFLPSLAWSVEPFGRLFTNPAERANLDHLRQTRKIEPVTVDQPNQVIEVAPTLPSEISVQGYVKRSDGKKGTVWVNDEPVQENSSTGEVEVGKLPNHGSRIQLTLPGMDRSLRIKAGQTYNPETDEITEESTRSKIQESGSIGVSPSIQGTATTPGQ